MLSAEIMELLGTDCRAVDVYRPAWKEAGVYRISFPEKTVVFNTTPLEDIELSITDSENHTWFSLVSAVTPEIALTKTGGLLFKPNDKRAKALAWLYWRIKHDYWFTEHDRMIMVQGIKDGCLDLVSLIRKEYGSQWCGKVIEYLEEEYRALMLEVS